MWETRDPDGRRVVLTVESWHIRRDHPELKGERTAIIESVRDPVARHLGRDLGEEWFYGGGFGPSVFVKVVIHFREGEGVIATAFPRRRFP